MNHATRYTVGFIGSIVLTLAAYFAVTSGAFSASATVTVIIVLAIVQLLVQLVCFLHLGQEERPRWKTIMFASMTIVLLIVVLGSVWIMNNLNYHMMSPAETDSHMMQQRDKGF